jgi:hypothetical protein
MKKLKKKTPREGVCNFWDVSMKFVIQKRKAKNVTNFISRLYLWMTLELLQGYPKKY